MTELMKNFNSFIRKQEVVQIDNNYIYSSNSNQNHICFGCKNSLRHSKYILSVANFHDYHYGCLKCVECNTSFREVDKCFVNKNKIFCKTHYDKLKKCAKCLTNFSPTDWFLTAGSNKYHLSCFLCAECNKQFNKGDLLYFNQQNEVIRLVCNFHHNSSKRDVNESSSDESENSVSQNKNNNKSKRVRTTFTEEQLQILQKYFILNQNPDGQDLERIAQETGLSKRVVQVWFQNSRARHKKSKKTSNTPPVLTNNVYLNSTSSTPNSLINLSGSNIQLNTSLNNVSNNNININKQKNSQICLTDTKFISSPNQLNSPSSINTELNNFLSINNSLNGSSLCVNPLERSNGSLNSLSSNCSNSNHSNSSNSNNSTNYVTNQINLKTNINNQISVNSWPNLQIKCAPLTDEKNWPLGDLLTNSLCNSSTPVSHTNLYNFDQNYINSSQCSEGSDSSL